VSKELVGRFEGTVPVNAAYLLQERARKGAFGVRQLAAALKLGLTQIIAKI